MTKPEPEPEPVLLSTSFSTWRESVASTWREKAKNEGNETQTKTPYFSLTVLVRGERKVQGEKMFE